MKILICSFTFYPDKNGVAAVVLAHAMHFVKAGHDVTIFTGTTSTAQTEEQEFPFAVKRFTVSGNANLKFQYKGDFELYIQSVRQWDGDVAFLHCWSVWTTDLLLPILNDLPFKVVMVSHGFDAQRYPRGLRFPNGARHWFGWFPYVCKLPVILRRFSSLVVLSHSCDPRWYFDHKVARFTRYEAVKVIPSAVDVDEFKQSPGAFRQTHDLQDLFVFLIVGNYFPMHKNQEMAVRAFAASGCQKSCLICIGSELNEYSESLVSLATELGIGNKLICLAGLRRSEVVAAYLSSDAVVCSSIWESGPIVLLEAMAAGKPFISTNVGFAQYLKGGIIANSIDIMANEMRTLRNSPSLCTELGLSGQHYCKDYHDWPQVMASYDRLLDELSHRN